MRAWIDELIGELNHRCERVNHAVAKITTLHRRLGGPMNAVGNHVFEVSVE